MEILYIILGWLLGILSPGIINRISDHNKKKALRRIIISELKDLKKRLMFVSFTVNEDYGTIDKELLIWTKTQIQDFAECELSSVIKDAFGKIDVENNDDLQKFLELHNSHRKDKPAFHFKEMLTSIIDSNLINIEILDNDFLTKLLEIKFQINTFNKEVQNINEYLKITFNSNITDINHQIIENEIKNKNLFIAKKAVYIVKKINNIIYSR